MLLVQLLVVRRSQSYHPLSSSSQSTSHLQYHINNSSSSSSSAAAARFSTNVLPRPLLSLTPSALHQAAFPRLTSFYNVYTQAPDTTASAATARGEEDDATIGDLSRAALPSQAATATATATTRNRMRRCSPSGSPVARALRTPSPAPHPPPPPSPSDSQGGRHALDFWKRWQRRADGDGGGLRRHSSSPSSLSTSQTRRKRQERRGAAQRVRYTERGSPMMATEADREEGSCLIGEEEGAAVYGEARRGRVRERDGLRWTVKCPEWEGVRTKVDGGREVDGGFDGGAAQFEMRTFKTQREWDRRRTEKVSMGYRWEEWDKVQVQKRAGSYWIVNDSAGVNWADEESIRQDWQAGEKEPSPELSVHQGRTFQSEEDEWKGSEDEQTVVRCAVDSASPVAPITRKARVISENWETYSRTPSEGVKPQDRCAGCTPGPGSRVSCGLNQSTSSKASNNGAIPQATMSLAQTHARMNPFTRPRRLTADPTPNRLAAARGSNKHFRKMNDDAESPTIQTLGEGVLPLSEGFQINIRSEQESDPFMEPIQHESKVSMDEIDGYLTRIWDLYADGDECSRRLLLQGLRLAIAAQEGLGPCP